MMVKDEWVRAAMTDDRVVVELLVGLKQAQAAKPQAVIPLRWGIRLPRSRPVTTSSTRCDIVSKRKEGDSSTRFSPTTPLSWSDGGGAVSTSATADGFEETSLHANRSPSDVRSKGTATTEATSTNTKRSRKKKTFSELKEEECLLLKEKIYLEEELATLHATVEIQRARNESLKRMKHDLNLHSAKKEIFNRPQKRESSSLSCIPSTLQTRAEGNHPHPESDSCETFTAVSNHDRFFLIPDLNMIPSEEDSGTKISS